MKVFNSIFIFIVCVFFGGVVAASDLDLEKVVPTTEKVIRYFNQAHLHDQAY